MQYDQSSYITESAAMFAEMAGEFMIQALDANESESRRREIDNFRRRQAMRLVPIPKLGYEHLFFQGERD